MNLSNLSVRRPVAMASLIIGLVFLGLSAFQGTPIEFMPRVDAPYITVVTVYPGASPRELESDVVRPIDDALATIEGVKKIQSSALENRAQTVIEFNLAVDVDVAANDVRDKIEQIRGELPDAVEDPMILKLDINATPIVNLALTGDVSVDRLYDYADEVLSPRLATIRGVAEVRLVGGSPLEVQVELDRDALAAHGLAATHVVGAIQQGIQTIPAGRVRQGGDEYSVKFDAEYRDIQEIGELQVAGGDGVRLYLKDIAKIRLASEEARQAAFTDGKPSIAVRVVKKSDANAAAVVERVRAQIDDVRSGLPGGVDLVWISDDGAFIQATVDSALSGILQGVGLTALILFLFLVDLRSTLIVAISMPVTYVVSMFFFGLFDFTLNTSTLLAIGLSVGVLVTNSIVVLERIILRLDELGDAREAARIGATDVLTAVLASALTNIVVLFPIAAMGGMVGRFLGPFATTMIIVTVVSLFISFTLTPLLASKLLKPAGADGERSLMQRLAAAQRRTLDRLSEAYARVLSWLGRRRWAMVGVLMLAVVALLGAGRLAGGLGFTMMADSDRGEIYVKLEYAARTDLDRTVGRVKSVEKTLADLPGLRHTYTTVGKVEAALGMASEGVHLAQIFLKFSPKTERDETIFDIQKEVRHRLEGLPGAIVTVSVPSGVGGQNAPIEIEVRGESLDKLDALAEKLKDIAEQQPLSVDADNSVRPGKPELRVRPRRAVLADLGMPAVGVGGALRANLAGVVAGSYKQGSRSYDIRVKLASEEGKEQVEGFLFPAAPGRPLTLGALATIEEERAPVQVLRSDKTRVVKVYANLAEGAALGSAVDAILAAGDAALDLPPGYDIVPTGQYTHMEESTREFGTAILIAIVLTVLVLAAIMESFTQPALVLVTLPLAVIGVVLGLVIAGESLSIFALLGVVMLIGIVVNNAILVMESVKTHIEDGQPPVMAMVKGASDQLRPVLMITLAATLGMLPMALATGLGGEARVGIGAASAMGIIVSGVLTLFVLPSLYMLVQRLRRRKA